jgi:hypothetical protein
MTRTSLRNVSSLALAPSRAAIAAMRASDLHSRLQRWPTNQKEYWRIANRKHDPRMA